MAYSLFISLVGGVTKKHLDHQIKTWLKYTLKCREFARKSESGIKQLKIELDDIFVSEVSSTRVKGLTKVPGQELMDFVDGMISNTADDVGEIGFRIEAV